MALLCESMLLHNWKTKAQISCDTKQADKSFVVRCLDSILSLVSFSEIVSLQIADVAEYFG